MERDVDENDRGGKRWRVPSAKYVEGETGDIQRWSFNPLRFNAFLHRRSINRDSDGIGGDLIFPSDSKLRFFQHGYFKVNS